MPEDAQPPQVVTPPAPRPPCAGCKMLRRRCLPDCKFAPFFPPGDDPARFEAVHKAFGASNVGKMLEGAGLSDPALRRRAADTLVREAEARVRDPGLGCTSYISLLKMAHAEARKEVDALRAQLTRMAGAKAAEALLKIDLDALPPDVRAEGERDAAAALKAVRERDDALRAVRDADDAEWLQSEEARNAGASRGRGRSRGPGRGQRAGHTSLQAAEAQKSAATPEAWTSKERSGLPPRPVTAKQRRRRGAAEHAGPGLPVPGGQGNLDQVMANHAAEAPPSAATAETEREQATTVPHPHAAAAARQHHDPAAQHVGTAPHQEVAETIQLPAATEVATEQGGVMTMRQQDNLAVAGFQNGHWHPHATVATTQPTAITEFAREEDVMMPEAAPAPAVAPQDNLAEQYFGTLPGFQNGHWHTPAGAATSQRATITEFGREEDAMMPQAAHGPTPAVAQQESLAAQYVGTWPGFQNGHWHPPAGASTSHWAGITEFGGEEDVMMMPQATPAPAVWQQDTMAAQYPGILQQMEEARQLFAASEVAKTLNTIPGAEQQFHDPAAARYEAMGQGHGQPPHQLQPQQVMVLPTVAEARHQQQDVMAMAQQAPAASDEDVMMQLLAMGGYDQPETGLGFTLEPGDLEMLQQMLQEMTEAQQLDGPAERAVGQGMTMWHGAAAEELTGAGAQEMMMMQQQQQPMAQYDLAELGVTQQMVHPQHLVPTEPQGMIMQQDAAAAPEPVDQEIAMLLQTMQQEQKQQEAMAKYHEAMAALDILMGRGHLDADQPMVQQMQQLGEQGMMQMPQPAEVYPHAVPGSKSNPIATPAFQPPGMMQMQPAKVYTHAAVPGSNPTATAVFQPSGQAEVAPFLVEQQLSQMGSSLPPLPLSLGQPDAQMPYQQHTGEDEYIDHPEYLFR